MWCEENCNNCPYRDCVLTGKEAVERTRLDKLRETKPDATYEDIRRRKAEKKRKHDREYRKQCLKDPERAEKLRERKREYKRTHSEECRAYDREYKRRKYRGNHEWAKEQRERSKKYYQTHKEERLEYHRQYTQRIKDN